MDVHKIRADFPILSRKINGKPLIYLDNAATSLKPRQVLEASRAYYEESNANIHRGLHILSEEASRVYESAHASIASFVNAKKDEVCFVKNATEGMNTIMYSLYNSNYFTKGDVIVTTELEHHANIVPWQFLEKKIGVKLAFAKLTSDYQVDVNDLAKKAKGAKLISVSGASNTVATYPDLKEIEKIAHAEGAYFAVDAAQLIPHKQIDFAKMRADFIAFSGHKMLAPTGTGALIGKKKLLEELTPHLFGGDMIQHVTWHDAQWNALPAKFEAGTPHIAGAYGLKAATEYISRIGYGSIEKHDQRLTQLCIDEMQKIKGITLYCPADAKKQGGIILFGSDKVPAHELALALSESTNICIRSGMHCAEPLVSTFNKEGLARVSFYMYNTEEEVLQFIKALKEVLTIFS